MLRPRRLLVSPETTPYYHCVSRCVRRAFLCGSDPYSGRSYEHRRQWVVERIHLLASVFAIDVCAYAVMHNHYHVVLRLGSSRELTDLDVIQRWRVLFRGPLLIDHLLQGKELSPHEEQTVADIVKVWRGRLGDISWFMKCLNEPIARRANAEDHCTGHFWESRFKSQALLTRRSLLACMAYVDLNPVRAGIAASPEASAFTSLQQRLKLTVRKQLEVATTVALAHAGAAVIPSALVPFGSHSEVVALGRGLPFSHKDYLALVDWTVRLAQPGKRAAVDKSLPPILDRLSLERERWLLSSLHFEANYQSLRLSDVKLHL